MPYVRRDPPAAEALRKILQQEQKRGFDNGAVTGGLDSFLRNRAEELRPLLGGFGSYARLTPEQRQAWAEAVLARLPGQPDRVGEREQASAAQGPAPALQAGARQSASPPRVQPRPVARPAPQPKARPRPPSGRVVEGQAASARPSPARKPAPTSISLDDDVTRLYRVSVQTAAKLRKLGVRTVRDLLYDFPFRHNDYANMRKVSQLRPGENQTAVLTVWEAEVTRLGNQDFKSTQAILGDETGNVRAVWFRNPYPARYLQAGAQVVLSGKVSVFRGQLVFESPEYELLRGQEELVHTGRLVPVYHLVERLSQKTLRGIVKQALDVALPRVVDFLPEDIRHRAGLVGLRDAIAQMHYPDSQAVWKAARYRLAFDELFLMQLVLLRRKQQWQEQGASVPLRVDRELLEAFLGSLPFALTGAQARALREVLEDLGRSIPMGRLLQGDVGSGKTVVALAALLVAASSGFQGALMAPTEVLAEQHFLTVSGLLSRLSQAMPEEYLLSVRLGDLPRPIVIGLLLGSMPRRAKEDMHRRLAAGEVDIVIGTHALIQEDVEIPRLALAVVDEQHRFGVMQRAALRQKGQRPHMLAMSATPIPRSLALTFYGDLDMSIIDELPPGRQQVRTRLVEGERRALAYNLVRSEVMKGRQAFIVCPLIEESEAIQSAAATKEHERLSAEVFPDLRLGLLHGRMSLADKQEVMGEFKRGELHILVSTPVVEVGIDVPNATVMLIDGADRFGLAQLHQFRGRVGRGQHQSYCVLVADSLSEEARERLNALVTIHDGFRLAEKDLELRGPGDYMGTRQSGLPDLKVAHLSDQDILDLARREAARLLKSDPELARPEHAGLAQHIRQYQASLANEAS